MRRTRRGVRRAVETLLGLQHPEGGFCGGPGQAPHLLPTYAATCALANAGQPGEGGGWDAIDREKMYDFFMSLKQPDGSFLVTYDGEVDVRGIYCLLAVATLLNLLTPELIAGTPEFLATCQTYEGGFGNASFPGWALRDDVAPGEPAIDPTSPRPPLGEAHGGYSFCALASWVLLLPYINSYPTHSPSLPKPSINIHSLLRWLAHLQGEAIELGGFKGRTNKLVDGCYSWWVGGCVGIIEGLLAGGGVGVADESPENEAAGEQHDDGWDDVDDSLYNRKALQEYILYAGQHPAGGLVDKPPKPADAYHTLYDLSGLSAAQHRVIPNSKREKELLACWTEDEVKDPVEGLRRDTFAYALSWLEEEGASKYVGGAQNRVNATHPLFNLTVTHAENMMAHFYKRDVPSRYRTKLSK
ncbi:unnamed protein product [Somion occarium]|uniref:Prenyltransferase alpha-alpha toroid domain-containing protein n=1 Tax=Somion occarium TaxID=3059160 RepID=A0ABP1D4Z6_9APHY